VIRIALILAVCAAARPPGGSAAELHVAVPHVAATAEAAAAPPRHVTAAAEPLGAGLAGMRGLVLVLLLAAVAGAGALHVHRKLQRLPDADDRPLPMLVYPAPSAGARPGPAGFRGRDPVAHHAAAPPGGSPAAGDAAALSVGTRTAAEPAAALPAAAPPVAAPPVAAPPVAALPVAAAPVSTAPPSTTPRRAPPRPRSLAPPAASGKRSAAPAAIAVLPAADTVDEDDGTLQLLPGRMEVVSGLDPGELRFVKLPFADDAVTFGRGSGERHRHIRLPNPTVSRLHAVMRFDSAAWTIANLSRTNPVVVNGEQLGDGEQVLRDGDHVEMGEVVLRFRSR
jgi:hypothetical protein